MNNVPESPGPQPWRLSKSVVASDQPFPKLGSVPDRPKNLPTPASLQAQVEELQAIAARAAAAGGLKGGRPDAASLGAPPAAQIEPVVVPPPPADIPPLDPAS